MKKIFHTSIALLTLVLATSCERQQEDLFNKSATERVDSSIEEYKKMLTSATNGWVFELFPGGNDILGGFNFTLEFNEDNVKALFELRDNEKTSTYKIIPYGGPTLSFDEYNEFLHYFTNPGPYSSNNGLRGDFEFLIISHTEDEIVLKGKKFGNPARLIRLKETPTKFMNKVIGHAELTEARGVRKIKIGEKEFRISRKDRVLSYSEEDGGVQKKIPFIYTEKGIRLYEPLDVNGKKVQELPLDDSGEDTVFKDADNLVSLYLYTPAPLDFSVNLWAFWADNSMADLPVSPILSDFFRQTHTETIDAVSGLTLDLENRFIFGTISGRGKGLYSFSYNNKPYGFATMYHLDFYGDKSDSTLLHLEALNSSSGTNLPSLLKFRNFIVQHSPYNVEATANPKIKKLVSKKDPNLWYHIGQLR